MNDSTSQGCNCSETGTELVKTVDDAIRSALVKFKVPAKFNNLTKFGDLGLTDKQLSVLLYSLEGKFKCDLGCPLPVQSYKQMTIVELKTKINGTQN